MRIAVGLETNGTIEDIVERARSLREAGITALWASQILGPDTLTTLAIVARDLPGLDVGTGVIPVQPRHPTMLAAQARTVQGAMSGHLSLGVGLSHQVVVEGRWGMSFERPGTYMREYLTVLAPMLRGEPVNSHGERISAMTTGALGPANVTPPSLLVAALGPRLLEMAGTLTDGTVLWMTGPRTIQSHIAPLITRAAQESGRGNPRIVCSLPIAVTRNRGATSDQVNAALAVYPTLPSYAAMMQREGANSPADVSLLGSRSEVRAALDEIAAAGASEFSAVLVGTGAERDATVDLLVEYAAEHSRES